MGRWEVAFAEGQAMARDEAVALALDDITIA